MLTNLLVIKESLNYLYKKHENYVNPILKFIFYLIIYASLNKSFGYATVFDKFIVVIVLALLTAVVPVAWSILFVSLTIIARLSYVSLDALIMVGTIILVVYLMYIRMVPKMGYIILVIPVLFALKIPYIIPLMVGVFFTPVAIVPTALGVGVYYFSRNIEELLRFSSKEILDMPETFLKMYQFLLNSVFGSRELVLTVLIFTIVALVTYFVSKMDIDFAWYVGIGVGGLTNIILFLVGVFALNLSVQLGWVFFGTILSVIVVSIMQFFKCTVDYSRGERVQFEDDEYYYYVKAIPKMKVTTPQKTVKKIIN